jgi:uncharacterized membrane protein
MGEILFDGVVLLAVLGSGVIAGVFFAFSAFVMAALTRFPAPQGIAAMQSINIVVLNRAFLGVSLGTAALCLILVVTSIVNWRSPGTAWLLVGAVLYLAGSVAVTRGLHRAAQQRVGRGRARRARRSGRAMSRTGLARTMVRAAASLAAAGAFSAALLGASL